MSDKSHVVGIDIAKDDFALALARADGKEASDVVTFDNTRKGFEEMTQWLQARQVTLHQLHVVLEPTGGFELALACWLVDRQADVCVVNPYAAKQFAKSHLRRNKTDAEDAKSLRQMGVERPTMRRWTPPTDSALKIRQLHRRSRQLSKMIQQEKNRRQTPQLSDFERQSIDGILERLETELQSVDEELERVVSSDEELSRQRELLRSIPCVGRVISLLALALIGGRIDRFASARQLAAFAGVTPRQHQSGSTIRGRTTMSKVGDNRLRAALWRPAQTAKRHNPVVKKFVDRLRTRDPTKGEDCLTGAAMHKMVRLMYGVLANDAPFDPNWATR